MIRDEVQNETYRDFERLLNKVVHDFIKKYGGDFEEYMAEANFAYVKAYKAHDPSRGRFSTLLVHAVQNQLRRARNVAQRHANRYGNEYSDSIVPKCVVTGSSPEYNLSELTSDAETVLDLVLNTPSELYKTVTQKGGYATNWQAGIKSHLRRAGWTMRRIQSVFGELATVFA